MRVRRPPEIRFRGRAMRRDRALIMAIVNRTPDSFYDRGATFGREQALAAVERAVADGADIVDIGGVKAGPGAEVGVPEEIRRVVPFVSEIRGRFPGLAISVDTWRHEVGRLACEAGADLLNDSWAGADPKLAEVAAEFGAGYVCTHTGGATPRTRPHRSAFADVVADVVDEVSRRADALVLAGVPAAGILIDPTHDFGKNTWHSLELTRRFAQLTESGWPVLASLSNKDFVGEALDAAVPDRVAGSLAVTAVCAWEGAAVFRAHNIAETRDVLEMVAVVSGRKAPARAVRGLA
jgi:dihydropteroate synthase